MGSEAKEEGAKEVSSSEEKSGSKKKKTKKKKKEKKEKKKIGGKAIAKKNPKDLYQGTGLDPDHKVRKKLTKKVKRLLKKAKDSSSGGSGDSSDTSEEDLDEEVLEDRSKMKRISQLGPGLLAAQSLKAMGEFVVQASGSTWAWDENTLAPIMSQYVRQHLTSKSSGGLLREAVSLAYISDLLIQARPAEALDCAAQRLKALELMMTGHTWGTAQKVELVPNIEPLISTRAEVQAAQKEARLEGQIKPQHSGGEKPKGKQKGKDKGKQDKGKGKAKDDGKKANQNS